MKVNKMDYLNLLAEKYPTKQSVYSEIINLSAILNLPKGTEHFMSDLHGEYEAFYHILNNCSGVIREKMDILFGDALDEEIKEQMCTLVYYPRRKLELLKREGVCTKVWYEDTIAILINLARLLSSKYTRSKVRKAMPNEFAYIMDELVHAPEDEDNNQIVYHQKIIETIISLGSSDDFIYSLAELIKRLAVDHLHILGDIYDRGPAAEKIVDLLMEYHSLDIQWGNHDVLWMGACAGSLASIANVIRNCMRYRNTSTLIQGYGIDLRDLFNYAMELYPDYEIHRAVVVLITTIMLKIEGQIIMRNPDFEMEHRLLLDKIDRENGTIEIEGKIWKMNERRFPTVDFEHPYELNEREARIMYDLQEDFTHSEKLRRHVAFLYNKGAMYKIHNNNLLYHGCIPMTKEGDFREIHIYGHRLSGKEYLDYADAMARNAFSERATQRDLDYIWYLWCGAKSPLCGRNMKPFERTFIDDTASWKEQNDYYYKHYLKEETCVKILKDFGLTSPYSHIINGHTPVRTTKGEKAVRANGRLLVIDGGFAESYHSKTGIAGYTLIYNSHGLRLKAHQPFESTEKALRENLDIKSESDLVETERERVMIRKTDNGKKIQNEIDSLKMLLDYYLEKESKQSYQK